MTEDHITPENAAAIAAEVDIHAPPPDALLTAHFVFGTNQLDVVAPLVADRHRRGLAPLIIVTGGINRHTGIIEGREFRRALVEAGVPSGAIRVEDRSSNTWQNVENSVTHIREALRGDLPITAVSKWFHRRALHALKKHTPELGAFYALGWEPVYEGLPVTRSNWPDITDGSRRVLRERDELRRTTAPVRLLDGAWI
ncbi:hypothetical protein GCM10022221_77950 [Actinocorallia aurea]